MPGKRFTVEQIIHNLREADVLLSQGKTVGEVCRRIGVSEQSYYRWRKEYGGLKIAQARRLKGLEQENARLKGQRDGVGTTSTARRAVKHTGPIQEKWRRPTPFALLLPRI